MDIKAFEAFLESQRGGFETFLKGCKDLNRDHMRVSLNTHSSKMTFALATELPILGITPHISSPFGSANPARSSRRSVTSPFKAPSFNRDQSPPSSNVFKSPGTVPEIPTLKRDVSSASNTPKSKRSADPGSAKNSPYGSIRTPSGGIRSILRGGTIGGAGRLFKPVTPTSKGYARDDDSSAGSPPLSDDSYTDKRSSHKRNASTKSAKSARSSKTVDTPKSPFELAAREAERKKPYPDSESTSDIDLPLPTRRPTLRKVSSAKSQKDQVTPKKGSGGMMDVDDDGSDFEDEFTPSKKQKTTGSKGAMRKASVEIDLTL